MKTTKILFGIFLILMLSLSVSAVGLFPQPVSGTVKLPGFQTLEGLDLYQKNLNTGVEVKTDLDASGYFVVDWSNAGYLDGQVVEISVGICKDNVACKRRVVLETGSPISIDFVVPPNFYVLKESEITYVCPDGSRVLELNQCGLVEEPVEKETINKEVLVDKVKEVLREVLTEKTVLKYVCRDGSEVDNKEDCPSNALVIALSLLSGLLVIVAGVLSKFKWGKGFVGLSNYYKNKGDEAKKNGKYDLAYKHYMRAARMLGTALEREKEDLYKKTDKLK